MTLHKLNASISRRAFSLSTVATLFLGTEADIFAIDTNDSRLTLRGIKAVHVVAESPHSDDEKIAFREDQIQTDVELQLRRVGITVVDSGFPILGVFPSVIQTTIKGMFAYHCALDVLQMAQFKGTDIGVSTWSVTTIGSSGVDNLNKAIRKAVADQVDKFLNAYLSVNPKPK